MVGVFIGMQGSNWNEERETRQRAVVFSERLREDLRMEAWAYAYLYAYNQDVLSNAERALGALNGKRPLSDEQLVISAYRASQYRSTTPHRATYDELVSTGAVGLIANPKLRDTALIVYVQPTMQRISDEGKASEYRALFRRTVGAPVQRSLLKNCGDRNVDFLDYSAIAGSIDYDCNLDLPTDEVSQAVQALRGQPGAGAGPAIALRRSRDRAGRHEERPGFPEKPRPGCRTKGNRPAGPHRPGTQIAWA